MCFGKSEKKTQSFQTTNQNQTTGPSQQVQDEGQSIFDRVKTLTEGSSAYKPYTDERVADMGADYGSSKDIIHGLNGPDSNLDAAGSLLDRLRGALRPDASVSDFMTPYTDGVLTPTLRNLARAREATRLSTEAQATSSGAFGDARHGIEDGVTNRGFIEASGDATNRAYADAFDKGTAQLNREREQASGLATAYQGLSSNRFNRSTALSRYLADFGNKDRTIDQARKDVAFSNHNENRDAPKRELEQLMQLLNLMPKSQLSSGTSTTQGTKTESQPDNSGLGLLGKLAGTALGGIFAPITGGLSMGLGSLLGGGLGGGGGGGGGNSGGNSGGLGGSEFDALPDSAFSWK
jgi:hypothetical protein